MPRDGAGNFTLAPGNPVVPGTVIEAAWANPTLSDIAANITDSLSRTGQGGMLVPFRNTDGTVGAPGMTWANEPSSGWYRAGLNDFWYSVGNENIFRITKTSIELAAGKIFVGLTLANIDVNSGVLIASNPGIEVTQTWNNGAVAFIGGDTNITDTASLAASRLERWRVGGVEKLGIAKSGDIVMTGGMIRNDTVDGADTGFVQLQSGSSSGATRGAGIFCAGNEHATLPGNMQIFAGGSGASNFIQLQTAGSEQVRIASLLNAVNFITLQGSVATGTSAIYVGGTDVDSSIAMYAKGVGSLVLGSLTNGNAFLAQPIAGGVDWIQVKAGNGGGLTPWLYPNGATANLDLILGTKGTGAHKFYTNILVAPALQLQVNHVAGATRNIIISGSNGGNPQMATSAGNIDVLTGANFTGGVSSPSFVAGNSGFIASSAASQNYYGLQVNNTRANIGANDCRMAFTCRNAAAADVPSLAISTGLQDTSTGAENANVAFAVTIGGGLANILTLNGNDVPGVSFPAPGPLGGSGGAMSMSFVGAGSQYGLVMRCNNNATHWLEWHQADNTSIGSISDNGAGSMIFTAFVGAHDSQLGVGERGEILDGTVMETLNEPCEFGIANEFLPKVKVSDTPGSRRAYGVFCKWDDPQGQTDTKDLVVAAVGEYVVRMAAGQPVQIGYVESAGNGCARFQANQDAPTAATLGEVNAAFVTITYPDGSFLMPCHLMKG